MKRYVVGLDQHGKSDILMEEDVAILAEVAPGILVRDLWISTEAPADLTAVEDPVANGEVRHEPPEGGAVFRVVRFMANDVTTPDQALAMHAALRSDNVPTAAELAAAKHPSMHRTDTLNYLVVISGEITMLTEGRDVVLKAGDVIVQKGSLHGWRNDGDTPCVVAGVLIDAMPVQTG